MCAKDHPDFITVTCLDWKKNLQEDRFKDVIIDSLSYLSTAGRISVYAFVIMDNHFHLLWQFMGEHKKKDVQHDFLNLQVNKFSKFCVMKISVIGRTVGSGDRTYQVWQRNSLSIPIWTNAVMWQKIDYIHNNPVKGSLCDYTQNYRYSSASFYYTSEKRWDFLVHCDGRLRLVGEEHQQGRDIFTKSSNRNYP